MTTPPATTAAPLLSGGTVATLIWIGLALFVMMLLPPTRALLAVVCGQLWKLLLWLGGIVLHQGTALLVRVGRAHMTIAANLLPRNAVLPTVAKKTTRKE